MRSRRKVEGGVRKVVMGEKKTERVGKKEEGEEVPGSIMTLLNMVVSPLPWKRRPSAPGLET